MKLLKEIWLWLNKNPIKTIVLAGVCFRITLLMLYGHMTYFPDSEGYMILSNRLLNLDLLGYVGERSPGYPLLLAVFSLPYSSSQGTVHTAILLPLLQLIKIVFVLLIPYNLFVALRERRISPACVISATVLVMSLLQAFATYGTNSRFSYPFEMLIAISVVYNLIAVRRILKFIKL